MFDNRKQQVNAFLNGVTSSELEEYLQENEISEESNKCFQLMKMYKEHHNETTHIQKLVNGTYKNMNNLYMLGEAYIIAMVMYYGLHKDFTVKMFVESFDDMFKTDEILKEYVYEIIKDFK